MGQEHHEWHLRGRRSVFARGPFARQRRERPGHLPPDDHGAGGNPRPAERVAECHNLMSVFGMRVYDMESEQVRRSQADGDGQGSLSGCRLGQKSKHDVLSQMNKEQKSSMDKTTKLVEQTGLMKESACVTFADLDIRDIRDDLWREDAPQFKNQTMECMKLLVEAFSSLSAFPSTSRTSSPSLAASYFDDLAASFQDEQCINQFASVLYDRVFVSEGLSPLSCTTSPPSAAPPRTPTACSPPSTATLYLEDGAAAPSGQG
ncbi:unnamed protein product [Prorocentrum cordatum]|uniref:Uncharacterized protein n=1 Tax=Prorocentrum cordatum TaxID=2364126 RepID=A0ABN9XAK7_9DINO|nr:unnamed protein product [Polarella glacialis]